MSVGPSFGAPMLDAYPPQKMAMDGIEEIRIQGVRGHLKMSARQHQSIASITIRHSRGKRYGDWYLSIDRHGKALVLEVFNVTMGNQWRRQIRDDVVPEFDIEYTGPARPVVAAWRQGPLEFRDWAAPLDVSTLKGSVHVVGGHGNVALQSTDAKVKIEKRNGEIKIHGDQGELTLTDIDGPVRASWVRGTFLFRHLKGRLRLDAEEGRLKLSGAPQATEIYLNRGSAEVHGARGTMKLMGKSSHWTVTASGGADVNVKSESGPVHVSWQNGGVHAFLNAMSASIRLPKKWLPKGLHRPHVREGQSASKALGQLFVRTQTGAISLSTGIP
jgi:ferric-dicitrate binding protein FerR (iron transport regulator)